MPVPGRNRRTALLTCPAPVARTGPEANGQPRAALAVPVAEVGGDLGPGLRGEPVGGGAGQPLPPPCPPCQRPRRHRPSRAAVLGILGSVPPRPPPRAASQSAAASYSPFAPRCRPASSHPGSTRPSTPSPRQPANLSTWLTPGRPSNAAPGIGRSWHNRGAARR